MNIHGQKKDVIMLSHGDGGLLTHQLLHDIFFPRFRNEWLDQEEDAAVLKLDDHTRLAFTTDSFVVSPLFFPGGNIGKLAVCGTINDLVVSGAKPLWLSAAFILPEGMSVETLTDVVASMSVTAGSINVPIVTGDTKVVSSNDPENLFINTTGIGLIHPEAVFNAKNIEPDDKIIITGSIGDHGAAVLAVRIGLDMEECPQSDCMPLNFLYDILRPFFSSIKVMRDPTRGGLATTLKELAVSGGIDLVIEEKNINVKDRVRGITDILGVDAYYLASEGRAVLIVKSDKEEEILTALKDHPACSDASVIGSVKHGSGNLYLRTALGGTRPLQMLAGTPLPRIC